MSVRPRRAVRCPVLRRFSPAERLTVPRDCPVDPSCRFLVCAIRLEGGMQHRCHGKAGREGGLRTAGGARISVGRKQDYAGVGDARFSPDVPPPSSTVLWYSRVCFTQHIGRAGGISASHFVFPLSMSVSLLRRHDREDQIGWDRRHLDRQ